MKVQKTFFAVFAIALLAAVVLFVGCGPSQLQQHFDSSAKQVSGQVPIITKPEVRYVSLDSKDASGQGLDPLRYAIPEVQGKKKVVNAHNAQGRLTSHVTQVWTERAPASGGGALVGALFGTVLGIGIAYATGSPELGAIAGLGGATAGGLIGHGIEQSAQPVKVKARVRLVYEEQIVLDQAQPDEPGIRKRTSVKKTVRKGKKVKVTEEDTEIEVAQAAIKSTVSVAPQGGGMVTVTTDRRHTNWASQYSDHEVEVDVPANTPVEQVKEMLNQKIGLLMASVF